MKSAIERRMEIVNVVNLEGKARVEDLAEKFNVSSVTIRSDLSFLEKNGYVVRSHGAAIPNSGVIAELTIHEKRRHNAGVKSLLGQAAAKLIHNGDTVILDSGTTTREIAASLKSMENVVVMTNGLDVAMELASAPGVEVLMSGGVLRKEALSFSGSQAETGLKNYRFDKVFLGVDGFDLRAGITTHSEQEASLNRLMCEISEQVIAVADSTKFGKRSCHMIREFGHIDILVTDADIPEDYLVGLREMKVEVIIVEKEH
ncbi:DeoR family transcriptional regulator [Photobacterium phosphoreum]|uniref:DeoR family transcriptional regulator n=1 Tax=Photobacterium phosphoreum TaxID=659 RepID=A0AAW5A0L6_PHOPO|nr:transcriptional repressor AgaR [Photobacterium phosphoreum]MCD9462095.1 DeoR family transcriptional regulator [Photobacterium phosphoreum]MCD9469345.1 DeoR family transcriptional regulator [Photobacterium phosphoreum]MCD9475450.1 DeoR family transcriptional regulator [Photobacterium phosphoreum]MCD9480471.1 DeoR family transcriptional regulator [Photobacterium phosphoreum]MCD9484165.1 DeoR family transcriptional regulator [Photobacterium phosphoreum]